jgi:hypothetical protein
MKYSCLIRNPHREAIADHFKLSPSDQQLIYAQRNVAGVVARALDNGTFAELEKVADGEANNWYLKAEDAWQPLHAVKRINAGC